MPAAAARLAGRVLQPFAKLVVRDLQRGRQAEENARSHRRQQGEGQSASIDANALQKRKIEGIEMGQPTRAGQGKKKAQRGAATGEDYAFGEHLPQQTE